MFRRWWPAIVLLLAAPIAVSGQLPVATAAAAPAAPAPAGADRQPDPSTVDPARRGSVLPAGWSGSTDLAWTTDGDATGFHLLVAEQRTGYTWRTAATLAEPGVETDRWVGNACVTGSGRRAVVVYAPRQFTNKPQLFDRGAFAAVVDLVTGQVTKLGVGATLAYYNPGCGAAETAVLTQGGQDLGKTRLFWLDAATGGLPWRVELPGQISSAVPVGDRIVAVDQPGLIQLSRGGKPAPLAATGGTAFDLHPDASGGVVFLEQHGGTAVARQARAGSTVDLASGPLTGMELSAGTGGRVFLSGRPASVGALPAGVSRVDAPTTAELSTQGQLAVSHDAPRAGDPAPAGTSAAGSEEASPVRLAATVLPTGQQVAFTVTPGLRPSQRFDTGLAPAVVNGPAAGPGGGVSPQAVGSPTDPVDADKTCAIARNDVGTQVYQPHWNQVEWAADLAVANALNIVRPANWKNSGMSSWAPQQTGMFPSVPLTGGGSVPPQVLLGVLTQESNLWQASRHTVEGLSGNPLIGRFYGQTLSGADPWKINWADADCGYGIGQITDGMRAADTAMTPNQKRALTVDYATNIAASLRILQQKWNLMKAAGINVNDGGAQWPENWYAAIWAYNTGMQPNAANGNTSGCAPSNSCTDGAGNWGLGYTNNPANISYPRNRTPFLEGSQDDARNPQRWPYQEKVLGWAAYPIIKTELNDPDTWHPAFTQAWWTSNAERSAVQAPFNTFCNNDDHCDINRSGEACALTNFHCWWHWPVTYKSNCAQQCGHTPAGYSPGAAEPGGRENDNYRPDCGTNGLPGGALVIDDQPNTVPPMRPCGRPANAGTFSLNFTADSTGLYRSKSDFHQIGAGYGDHFWFAHTRTAGADSGWMKVTGMWTLNQSLNGWARVLVHLPDHGAQTQQARYDVDLGNGTFSKFRVISQGVEQNKWVSLGVYPFAGPPKVRLSNVTLDGYGEEDVAWDAVAIQPLPGKPRHIVAALGDSYSSGEGAGNYYRETDDNHGSTRWAACRRSRNAWPRKMT
ncbi:MAG TPA: hypothetical protein VMU51_07810, partial [Mycobacteriales bacterium]|nr:hypothetical protein [Mycobacteriales bacterium]